MVPGVDAPTVLVVTVNVVLVAPAGTVTLPGTVAAVLLLDRVTDAPPAGAGPFSVTVPVEFPPPVTVVGFSASERRDRRSVVWGKGGDLGGRRIIKEKKGDAVTGLVGDVDVNVLGP